MLIRCSGRICPTALRCPKKSSRCSLARFFRPLRVLRLAASATGGAQLRTPYPSPVAGEGPSGQIAAYPTHSLDSVTSCYRFAVTPIKCAAVTLRAYLRRRTDDVYIVRIQPQLKRYGALGHSPKRVLVWGPRRDARPAGERRSGGALEGCLSHRDSDPTWSKARDDAHE